MPNIGRYEIERELGRGAMGVVYLAHDPQLHRQVAVKTYSLPDGVSAELAKEFHERFLREARAAASLSHPGIVTIFDAGEDSARGLPYIAMEFIPGMSLKQRLERGDRLDLAWVISFGAILADALHLAHRAGIIHRDIKPANILIGEGDGAAKIADFGVARLKTSDLTRSGAALGSPGYMSPEQIRGAALDGRSDLFSLAVVLYEAVCGKRPFHGDDLVSLAYSIAHDTQVPLSRQFQGCSAGLDTFFDRALSKDPAVRFPDGAAFRQALLNAGSQVASDPMERTVTDAATVGLPSPAAPVAAAGSGESTAALAAGLPRRGRGRLRGLTLASVGLVSIGLVVAASLILGRHLSLKAGDREARIAGLGSAGVSGQGPSGEEAAGQRAVAPREVAADRGTPGHPEQAGQQEKAVVRKGASHMEVEPVAQTPKMPRNIEVTVPAGTAVRLTLDTTVGSASSQAGNTITAKIAEPVVAGDRVAIPAGSRVHGRVIEANPAQRGLAGKAGSLSLSFDKVVTPFGFAAPMSATTTSTGAKSGKKNAEIIGGSAAGGALLGRVFGGKSKNAAVGTIVGAAVGTGIAASTRGQDVEFAAGSSLTVRLDQPIRISIQP